MATRDEHGRELPDGVYVDAEPSAPDELARLLPGLAHDLDMVTDLRFESQRSTPIQRVARACSLLLDERERMTAAFANLSDDRIALHAGNEAQRDISATQERAIDALRARVAELEAAPAGHRVAALLRAVEARQDEAQRDIAGFIASEQEVDQAYEEGRSAGLSEARNMITAHIAAPSPLDLAAAEVCALDVETVADPRDAIGFIFSAARAATDRRGLATIVAIGLRALACDAKGGA